MSKIISIASCKGGIGKTTSTINLGTALAMQGKHILLVDNDAQSSLTSFLNLKSQVKIALPNLIKAIMDQTSSDELFDMVNESIIKTKYLDVIPSTIKMAGLELGMSMVTAREYILKNILKCIKDHYDIIFIDCLPSLGIFAVNALTASDTVIIPVETHYGGLEGFDQILHTINMVREQLNPNLSIEGIVMTKHQERTVLCRSVREMIKEDCGKNIRLFEPPIPFSIRVAEQSGLGISIFEHDPKNPAALAYETIAKEVGANA